MLRSGFFQRRNLRVRYALAFILTISVLHIVQLWQWEPPAHNLHQTTGIQPRDLHIFTDNAINNTAVIVPVNSGMLHFAENMLCSLKQTDFNSSALIFWALDAQAEIELKKRGYNTYRNPALFGVSSDVNTHGNTAAYKQMMRERPVFYADILTSGIDILMLDADIVFWDNPLSVVPAADERDSVDIIYSTDAREFYTDKNAFRDNLRRGGYMPPICNGMFWMKARKETVSIWTDMLAAFEASWWRLGLYRLIWFQDDQRGVDVLLNDGRAKVVAPFPTGITGDMVINANDEKALKVRLLDQAQAVNGHLLLLREKSYEANLARLRKQGKDRLLAHMNWSTVTIGKVDGAKKKNIYYLDDQGKCTL
ncbi:hypothetical protein VHEMI06120 [[Torrubiella] hemipterigena]|uniref:Nucleotide-diphospho-sugar transferase domain-containing protein n=1 Tax=[Torrubiella] hemipterigena TaxID=1531966 RepID=A0A0A1T688_9HYPO|nr:hypothetical protein VHEMI06120 [[Torrubiella] hemipterigena]